MKEAWRVFNAIQLPSDVRIPAFEHITRLRKAFPDARASWSRSEALHLTLKFIGEIERTRVERLSNAVGRACGSVNPFEMIIGGVGVFPPRGMPRVLWLGVKSQSESLAALQLRLEDECAVEGFEHAGRVFHPHLTIARLRPHDSVRELVKLHSEIGFTDVTTTVSELVVMRSELGPGGSRYSIVSKHALGAGS